MQFSYGMHLHDNLDIGYSGVYLFEYLGYKVVVKSRSYSYIIFMYISAYFLQIKALGNIKIILYFFLKFNAIGEIPIVGNLKKYKL